MKTKADAEFYLRRSQEIRQEVRLAAQQTPPWVKEHISKVWNECYPKSVSKKGVVVEQR